MPLIDFLTETHNRTARNYVQRVVEHDKAECTEVARQFGFDYWDGDRKYGYGGYKYDGRWRPVADKLARHYGLKPGSRVLDVGCAKGFLLYDLTQVVAGIEIAGLDVSAYAIAHARDEVKPFLQVGSAADLPFPDASFDLVAQLNVPVYFAELGRVTAPGGCVVVASTLGPRTPYYTPHSVLRRKLARRGLNELVSGSAGPGDFFIACRPS